MANVNVIYSSKMHADIPEPACSATTVEGSVTPLNQRSLLEVTPSNTTVTLPTPDPARVQLASIESHNPPRFIFYPISWDGSEDPSTQKKLTAPPNLTYPDLYTDYVDDDQLNSPSAVFCSTDAFSSIDRWRRGVVKCNESSDLLDPIQDVDTPLPLLSLPHDRRGGLPQNTQPINTRALPRGTDSTGSEDEVQLWVHP